MLTKSIKKKNLFYSVTFDVKLVVWKVTDELSFAKNNKAIKFLDKTMKNFN